jgi:LuxR family maltose regulon positive regulatory protein
LLGERKKALATIGEASRDSHLRGGISQGYLQANPCFVYWLEADLPALMQTARGSLKAAEKYQAHQAIAHGLYFLGIAHYHRNELHTAEEHLTSVVEKPYSQHALNFVHSAFALALVHQALGRTDAANEVAESAVSYGLDTHNPALVKLARGFQAELAIRQGRTAEVSLWTKQFDAEPFSPMYRFYVPQLTLARALLAEETIESREQAADLLKRLYDFVVSTHNRRFQIDVLALQALLHDTLGEVPAAMEKIAKALALAEPGGFIRPFVDLGTQMGGLLKELMRRNIPVGHVGKVLGALWEDTNERTQLGDDQNSKLPYLLSEPLTNRELDVLDLLARRLSDKEIAAELVISPATVKGHLKHIYGKLDVGKRREAVEKAKKIGIL